MMRVAGYEYLDGMPEFGHYSDLVAWAQQNAEIVLARKAGERFRPLESQD